MQGPIHIPLLIGGQWVAGVAEAETRSPYSRQVTSVVAQASPGLVHRAVGEAWAEAERLAGWPAYRRAEVLSRAATLLTERADEFARAISCETGKPLKDTCREVARAAETLLTSAEEAKRLGGEVFPLDQVPGGEGKLTFWVRVPVGVVGAISPFNAPLNLICHKVGPAFAAGNATVLKPAPQAPLVAYKLVQLLLEAGMPPGAVQLVFGGPDIGEAIVRDARVPLISFTGSAAVGARIAALAGMRRTILELGGNAATIVHEDANVDAAARAVARAGFSNSGQSCISVQRLYVHQRVLEPFLDRFLGLVDRLKVGDPLDPESDIGSMIDETAACRVESWVNEAIAGGARLLLGHRRQGATYWPTVLTGVRPGDKVVCHEVFGPLVSVIPYEDIEDCFRQVNDSNYGLQAGIFTRSLPAAMKAIRRLKVGGVVVNGPSTFRLDPMPYGGVKESGVGREGPRFAAAEMTEMRLVIIDETID